MDTHPSHWHSSPRCAQTEWDFSGLHQPASNPALQSSSPTMCPHAVKQPWLLLAPPCNRAPVTKFPFYPEFCFAFGSLGRGTVTWLLQHTLDILPRILFTTITLLAKHVLHLLSRTSLFLFHSLTGTDSIPKTLCVNSQDCDSLQFLELCRHQHWKRRGTKILGNTRRHQCRLPGYEAGSLVDNIPDLRRRVDNSHHRLGWCCFLFWLLFRL